MRYKIIVNDSRIEIRNAYDWSLYLTAQLLALNLNRGRLYGRRERT